jgi:hypothetical protein
MFGAKPNLFLGFPQRNLRREIFAFVELSSREGKLPAVNT